MSISNVKEVIVDKWVKIPCLISAFGCVVEKDEVNDNFVRDDNCYILNINGDSMEPTLFEGDLCLIDVNANPSANEIVAVERNGEFIVRRFRQDEFSTCLYCDNPKYPEIKIQNTDSVMIIGVVYGYTRKV